MPLGRTIAQRQRHRIFIEGQLPDESRLAYSGRAVNLVDPSEWIDVLGGDRRELLSIRITVCRPLDQDGAKRRALRREIHAFEGLEHESSELN